MKCLMRILGAKYSKNFKKLMRAYKRGDKKMHSIYSRIEKRINRAELKELEDERYRKL